MSNGELKGKLKKARANLDRRINAWMASPEMRQGGSNGYKKPGSMKR